MEAPRTEESMADNQTTGQYGTPNLGSSADSFSCPQRREVVRGVATYPRLLLIPPEVILTALRTILTSEKRAVTLCACRAPEPSTGVRFCALDAEGKVITALPEVCAGIASRKPSGNGSYFAGIKKDDSVQDRAEFATAALKDLRKSLEKMENGSRCQDE